jgi:hypothetical protein
MKTEPPAGATGRPIVLSIDAIIQTGDFTGSRLFRRGEPTPYRDLSEVPGPLRGFVVTPGDSLPEAAEERFGSFEPNVSYSMHSDGSRGRAIRRVAGQLAAADSFQQWAEEQASAPPDEALASALAIVQEQHDIAVALQIKELEIRDRDAAAAIAAAEAEAGGAEEKPAVMLYVRRGGVWAHAEKAKLRPAEQVFVKEPSGEWAVIGVVDANGGLPEVTIL